MGGERVGEERRVWTLNCSDRKRDGEDEREESERREMKRIKMLNR